MILNHNNRIEFLIEEFKIQKEEFKRSDIINWNELDILAVFIWEIV